MIKSTKVNFIKAIDDFSATRMNVDFSKLPKEKKRAVSNWPASVTPFFPLATSCSYRKESPTTYLLMCYDMMLEVEIIVIEVLEHCNGYKSSREIKRTFCDDNSPNKNDSDAKIELILKKCAELNIIQWIPYGQRHIDANIV